MDGWIDRYLPKIPYDDIAQNKIVGDGIDLFDYYLTNRQVNRLREALSTNTTLTFVELDWRSITSIKRRCC